MFLLILLLSSCFLGSHQAIISTTSTSFTKPTSSTSSQTPIDLYSIQPITNILSYLTYKNFAVDPTDGNFWVTPNKIKLAFSKTKTVAPGNAGLHPALQVNCIPFQVLPVDSSVNPIDLSGTLSDYSGINNFGMFIGLRSNFYEGAPTEQETVCYVANYEVMRKMKAMGTCLENV